jgi:hypothetical protein
MQDIKEWCQQYCSKNSLSLEELQHKALIYFKRYIEREDELYNYMLSKEFKNVIKKLNGMLEKEKNSFNIRLIKEEPLKIEAIRNINNINIDEEVINNNNVEIIELSLEEDLIGYMVISFENDNDEYGKYAFLHYVKFTEDRFMGYYKKYETLLLNYIKSKSFSYFDRIISEASMEEFESLGYLKMNSIINLKLVYNEAQEENVLLEDIEEKRIRDEAFSNEENIKALIKAGYINYKTRYEIINKVKIQGNYYYLLYSIKNEKALIHIYIDKDGNKDINYEEVLTSIFYKFYSMGIKEIYTSIYENHIMILKKIGQVTYLSKQYWIRKIL